MKSQSKNSSQQLAETSFFGTETQESLESRLSEDDGEEEEKEGSDEEQASGKQKRPEVDEPVKAARKKKKGVKRKSEGKSSFNLFRLLAVLLWFSDSSLSNYFCETDTEPEKSEEEGIQWMSSQDTAKDPKKESKDKLSLKRLKQLHQEKV